MNYAESIEFLYSRVKFGAKLGLDNINIMLESLGCPHKKSNYIHITGTNGKGSVASMVSSILIQTGYKVGLYTSPHLTEVRERIQINRKWITKREFSREMSEIKRIVDGNNNFCPTFFEILTAIALDYFALNKVDFVVLEVGMGGRLDATNVVNPLVSVITNIGLEHTEHLGKKKTQIAREKVEIIKDKSFVIAAETDKVILEIINEKCNKNKAKLLVVGRDINYFYLAHDDINYQTASFEGRIQRYENIKIPLLGKHQVINAATVIGVMEALLILGVDIPLKAIKQGIFKAEWRGRFQIINRDKTNYILDCAHNVEGFSCLTQTINNYFPRRKFSFIVAFSKDKDIDGMLKLIAPYAKEFVFPNIKGNDRIINKTVLENRCRKNIKNIKTTKVRDVKKAIEYCKNRELVFITGSIFLVGEAFKELEPELQSVVF